MKRLVFGILLANALLHWVTPLQSQSVVNFDQPIDGGGWGGSDQVQGWEFIPQTEVTVLELGLYDGRPTGGFQQSHEVAIWDGNGNLIASASIPQGDSAPLQNNFRYESISVVQLNAGETYVIGAYMPAPVTDYTVLWSPSALADGTVSFDPRIEFVAYCFGYSPGGISFPESRSTDVVGAFGPNFVIAVPEPSTFALLLTMASASFPWMFTKRGRRMVFTPRLEFWAER